MCALEAGHRIASHRIVDCKRPEREVAASVRCGCREPSDRRDRLHESREQAEDAITSVDQRESGERLKGIGPWGTGDEEGARGS